MAANFQDSLHKLPRNAIIFPANDKTVKKDDFINLISLCPHLKQFQDIDEKMGGPNLRLFSV